MVVIFYNITVATDLANTEPCSWGKYRLGSYEILVTFLSTDQHIILFYVFLFIIPLVWESLGLAGGDGLLQL